MASNNRPVLSFDQFVQENRQKKAAENLAQRLLGSKNGRRSSAPPTGPTAVSLSTSFASRVGITKRNSSLPRAGTPRAPRSAVAPPNRIRSDIAESRPSSTRPEVGSRSTSVAVVDGASNGGGSGMSIRGAAAAQPLVIVAQNFAPGTTAADIESVMLKVGGEMSSCKLVASHPTVIAEMVFRDPRGADEVIEQFNGKKADGRTLYVYRRDDGGARRPTRGPAQPDPAPEPVPLSLDNSQDAMVVDEAAEAREANDRRREERRGRDDRDRERDVFPTGPRGYRDDYYRRSEGGYADGRYGYGGSGRGGDRDGYSRGARYDAGGRGYGGGGGGGDRRTRY